MANHKANNNEEHFKKTVSQALDNCCHREVFLEAYAELEKESDNFGAALAFESNKRSPKPKTFAARGLIHLLNGWRNLSCALNALLSGGSSQSVHFAYYAEYRAILSILSINGICIEERNNYYLDAQKNVKNFNKKKFSTHSDVAAIWEIFCNRAQENKGWDFWSELSIGTISLKEIETELKLPSGTLESSLSSSIKEIYEFRINNLDKDKQARNDAAYSTDEIHRQFSCLDASDIKFVQALWQLVEPTESGLNFEIGLFKYVLTTMRGNSVVKNEFEPEDNTEQYVVFKDEEMNVEVDSQYDDLDSSHLYGLQLQELHNEDSFTGQIFSLASEERSASKNIIARGFIILRLAMSLYDLKTSKDAETNKLSSLSTWITEWLVHSGLIDPRIRQLEDRHLSWADYSEILTYDPEELSKAQPPFHENKAIEFNKLSRIDAVLIWGLKF